MDIRLLTSVPALDAGPGDIVTVSNSTARRWIAQELATSLDVPEPEPEPEVDDDPEPEAKDEGEDDDGEGAGSGLKRFLKVGSGEAVETAEGDSPSETRDADEPVKAPAKKAPAKKAPAKKTPVKRKKKP